MNDENPEKKVPVEETVKKSQAGEEAKKSPEDAKKENPEEKKISREEELLAEIKSLNDRYLRLAADFDNFRKRSARESSERVERAVEHFAVEILEVVDNIERALGSDDTSLREGVEQIQKILRKILANNSISPIESLNEKFNPQKHEAIAYIPSDCEEGTVIDEVQRGYCIKDKVIRCAKVAVSNGKNEKKEEQ
ncbi:molecular chaperone GrpE [Methanomicrobium sp. W14]|uniref:nucleotide exchange factor GrpE n=1 Tax=Methanomicrobium sp. W14 TaxID=2817839 RepID=UPI001AE74112|nr:nucleotide exchange factor GrpE [Methanomicrobium sp. W14]MBP2133883.1 molecular chaperone GrpE [Methanomicrobium sp. W14]